MKTRDEFIKQLIDICPRIKQLNIDCIDDKLNLCIGHESKTFIDAFVRLSNKDRLTVIRNYIELDTSSDQGNKYKPSRFRYWLREMNTTELNFVREALIKLDLSNTYDELRFFDTFVYTIEDFDNITEDDLKFIVVTSRHYLFSALSVIYGDAVYKSFAETLLTRPHIINDLSSDTDKLNILKCIPKDKISGLPVTTFKDLSAKSFYELTKLHEEWYMRLNDFIRKDGLANNIYKGDFDDIFKTAAIIAECCRNKNIPTYQLNRIKNYAALLRIHNFDFKLCLKALLDIADNPEKMPVVTFKKKSMQKKYIVVNLDNYTSVIYDTEEEANKAYIENKKLSPNTNYIISAIKIKGECNDSTI